MEDWLGWIVAFIVVVLSTIVVIRATVRFDLNEWKRDRIKQNEERLRRLCPQVYSDYKDGEPAVGSLFVSPRGTSSWRCEQRGSVMHNPQFVDSNTRYCADNPYRLLKRMNKFDKLSKKFGYSD